MTVAAGGYWDREEPSWGKSGTSDVRNTPPFENREGRGSLSVVLQSAKTKKSLGQPPVTIDAQGISFDTLRREKSNDQEQQPLQRERMVHFAVRIYPQTFVLLGEAKLSVGIALMMPASP